MTPPAPTIKKPPSAVAGHRLCLGCVGKTESHLGGGGEKCREGTSAPSSGQGGCEHLGQSLGGDRPGDHRGLGAHHGGSQGGQSFCNEKRREVQVSIGI